MLRGYPAGGWGMPGILMPAACPTLMGCMFALIGPVKPPLDAISKIHKWFKVVETSLRFLSESQSEKILTEKSQMTVWSS